MIVTPTLVLEAAVAAASYTFVVAVAEAGTDQDQDHNQVLEGDQEVGILSIIKLLKLFGKQKNV